MDLRHWHVFCTFHPPYSWGFLFWKVTSSSSVSSSFDLYLFGILTKLRGLVPSIDSFRCLHSQLWLSITKNHRKVNKNHRDWKSGVNWQDIVYISSITVCLSIHNSTTHLVSQKEFVHIVLRNTWDVHFCQMSLFLFLNVLIVIFQLPVEKLKAN